MTKNKSQVKKSTIVETVKAEVERQLPKVDTGIAVALPNTIEQKMQAICDLAEAVKQLAIAVKSVNVEVHIEGCHLQNHKTGIHVQ